MLYPNPAQSALMITFNNYTSFPINIDIYDALGKKIHTESNANRISRINVGSFSAGNYIVRLSSGGEVYSKKFIKQ